MITWESELGKALARGKAEQKSILLEFFSPACISCAQMEEVTFADTSVANYITDKLVALRVPVDPKPLAADFRVVWTPTLIILDYYGKEHQRILGFLPPEEMLASMLLGVAKVGLDSGQYNEAVIHLNTLLNGCPECVYAPEAVYLRGVSRFLATHDPKMLNQAHQQLSAKYPGTEWEKKAQPFRLL